MSSPGFGLFLSFLVFPLVLCSAEGQERCAVKFAIADGTTKAPLPCRIHLKDSAGKAVRADPLPFWFDHFACDGAAELAVPPGTYAYLVERGPEFARQTGSFEARAAAPSEIAVTLSRIADLAAEGWWSGDLHVHRPVKDMPLLMRAEDLHVAPVITWWNKTNPWKGTPVPADPLVRFEESRCYHVMAGEDERQGGAFLYFNLDRPLDIAGADREYPSPLRFLELASAPSGPQAWIDLEKPFWWDIPAALAHGFGHSIGLVNNHLWHGGALDNEAWGKPRDRAAYPPPRGNGLWSQHIYYHILNSGIRIPPSAGSASGVLANPLGYNRVYVHVEKAFSHEKWWAALREGRCFVTNGPLLRVLVDGMLPGHAFKAADGQSSLELDIDAHLDSNDPVPVIELVVNGTVVRTFRVQGGRHRGRLGTVRIDRSGWFLVRAVAEVENTLRLASTGPYHVEIGGVERRVSRSSAQFFLDWVNERAAQITLGETKKRAEIMKYHEAARKFWEARVKAANAD